jgi:hypothetical protein
MIFSKDIFILDLSNQLPERHSENGLPYICVY